MTNRFRLRISRVIASFQSCRSKDATTLSVNLTGDDYSSSGSSRTRRNGDADELSLAGETPAYLWRKEENWHVVARVGPSSPRRKIASDDGELFPPLPIRRPPYRKNGKRKKKKKRSAAAASKVRVSNSSPDTPLFTSEDEYEEDYYGESETLLSSSRSLSTESSADFNSRLKPIRESSGVHEPETRGVRWPSPEGARGSSMMRWLMPCVTAGGGKVGESFAVVKRSEDPYGDFRQSMMEMIVEKQLCEEGELEQLLHCFLSLNSGRHHPVIVRAFSEIWDALFSAVGSSSSAPTSPFPPASVNP